jgi:bifunctional DNase/RNase
MTHDLLKLVAEELGASVDRVVVTNLEDGTFFADLVLTRGDQETVLSARPSDAIALAARTTAAVFAERALLDEVGVEIQDEGQEEEIERFREFLNDIRPEDFGAGSTDS